MLYTSHEVCILCGKIIIHCSNNLMTLNTFGITQPEMFNHNLHENNIIIYTNIIQSKE